MKNYLLTLIVLLLFSGCAIKMDPTTINKEILPQKSDDVTQFLDSKTYSTYDEKGEKITRYYFKTKDGELQAAYEILFLPRYAPIELYEPFSDMKVALDRLTNKKAHTIKEALVMEVKKNDFKKLYTDKEEYIIGNDFARDLMYAIRQFNERMEQRYDDY